MKKFIGLLLALCMTFTMSIGVGAYSDVEKGTYVSEAVSILSNLGILDGFEDGSFMPGTDVTRAQMAKIVCHTLGYHDLDKQSTDFTDVPSSHWASGYIAMAQNLEIVNGFGDGTFKPEDTVSYEQAIKMIVCALGYEPMAQARGGWYNGYLNAASTLNITKNTGGVINTPASRQTVACLVYNALDVQLMDQETWNSNGEDEYGKTDETILSKYLEVKKYEGIVSAVPYMNNLDDDDTITLSEASYEYYIKGTKQSSSKDTVIANSELVDNANSYLGKRVVAYIGEDDYSDETIFAIAEAKNTNNDFVLNISKIEDIADDEVIYTDDRGRREEIDIDDLVIYENFKEVDEIDTDKSGIITFISNNTDNKYDVAIVTAYTAEGVIEDIDEFDGVYSFSVFTGDIEDIDTEDEDVEVSIIKDGKVVNADALAVGDTVSTVDLGDRLVYYVSSKVIEGTVDSMYDDKYEIDGEDYVVSNFYGADIDFIDGVFYLNVDGEIAYHDEVSSSNRKYGLVTAVGATTGINSGYEAEVVLANGTRDIYKFNSKVRYNGKNITDAKIAGIFATALGDTYSEAGLASTICEITIKNNKITRIDSIKAEGKATDKEYDEENMTYGKFQFDDNTIVFSIDILADDDIDVSVGKVTDYMVDGEGEEQILYAYDNRYNDAVSVVVGFNMTDVIADDSDAVIISKVSHKRYEDDDAIAIEGIQGGVEVEYILYDEYGVDDADKLSKGDIILVGAVNSDNVVSEIEWLYDYSEHSVKGIANPNKEIYYLSGDVDFSDGNKPDDKSFMFEGNNEPIVLKASANYTLVDDTNGFEVSKKSKSKSIFGNGRYNTSVFVRYCDDKLVEVVVYRNLID